jgi:hypothetical protein
MLDTYHRLLIRGPYPTPVWWWLVGLNSWLVSNILIQKLFFWLKNHTLRMGDKGLRCMYVKHSCSAYLCNRLKPPVYDVQIWCSHHHNTKPHSSYLSFQCCTSCVVVQFIAFQTMDILMPETCWDKERWINFICVASS